ncbi:MAG: signal peptidase I [Campylobacterales bacterium]|nr:signal peptidase I [Campylobacterales bacterium]
MIDENIQISKIEKLYEFSNSWTGTVIIVLMVIFFLAQAFVIPTGSMKHTLLEGDHLLVKKYVYGVPTPTIPWIEQPVLPDFKGNGHLIDGDMPKRGDIVVFRYPKNPKLHYVKRMVAIGGDEIMLRGKKLFIHHREGDEYIKKNFPKEKIVEKFGKLWVEDPYRDIHPGVNNHDFVHASGGFPDQVYHFGPIVVDKDKFFMMGDNRDHSSDSRFWGSVEYKYIIGTPWFVYFSWENRSYEKVANGGLIVGADLQALEKVCPDIDPFTQQCKKLWDENMYKVRWERVGKTMDGLEELLRK